MALSKPILVPLLLISFLALFLPNKVVVSQDTTSFTVDSFPSVPTDLIYQGDAHVPSGSEFLRLTKTNSSGHPSTWTIGRVLYSNQVLFWDAGRQASFETTIRFVISQVDSNPADGIAFFIAPVGSTIPAGATGGRLGVFDPSGTSPAFAVEFDTHVNSALGDPSFRHIGIDINSINSRNVTRFDRVLGQEVTARINYEATTRKITVTATAGSETVTVTDEFDLKAILPGRVQVGISGASGVAVALHDIHAWYFTSTMVSETNNIQQVV